MRIPILSVVLVVSCSTFADAQTLELRPAPDAHPIAQVGKPQGSSSEPGTRFTSFFSRVASSFARLPSTDTAMTLGLGGAFALAVSPLDRSLTRRANRSAPLDEVLEFGNVAGNGWPQAGLAAATLVAGSVTGRPLMRSVGADLVQAQIVTTVLTEGLKLAADRERPDGGRLSFPSGHASSTFANAAVLEQYFGWKVGVPAYAVASYVGISRLQENRHYASDVIFGAAIGLVAGRTVTVGHGVSRIAVLPMTLPGGVGVTLQPFRQPRHVDHIQTE
jgi:membrane-associated phospholipid phosphatase